MKKYLFTSIALEHTEQRRHGYTWRDRSRIAGGRAGEGGSTGAPRRRSGPSRAYRCAKCTLWQSFPRRVARGGFSRRFPPIRNYFRFCKSTYVLTPASILTLFLYYRGFKDILDSSGHFSKHFWFPNSTSGPTPGTGNGMPPSLFH